MLHNLDLLIRLSFQTNLLAILGGRKREGAIRKRLDGKRIVLVGRTGGVLTRGKKDLGARSWVPA